MQPTKTLKEIVAEFPVGTWLVISEDGKSVMAASASRVQAEKMAKDVNGEFLIRVPQISPDLRKVQEQVIVNDHAA
jgi:hypothetical protein